jgi:guanylate kinase
MNTLILLMGGSGSGKSYLEHNLITLYPDMYKKIISITTRQPRKGEQHGVDYYFTTDEAFSEMNTSGKIIQQTEFAGVKYGSLITEYLNEFPSIGILVLIPSSAKTFIPVIQKQFPHIKIIITFFDISRERIKQNMLTRGDNIIDIEKRLSVDNISSSFKETGLEPNCIITDIDLTENLPHRYTKWISKRLKKD